MAKHIVIERPNGVVTIVRSELETPSETPLTEHEQIINELYGKVKNLGLFSVSQQRELLEALKGIIQCCDGNEPRHEQIYHIANDAVKACNCG